MKVNYHLFKFGGHRHCGIENILVCHVISHNHMIKESCDFISKSSSRLFTILLSLLAIDTVVVEI